MFYGDRQFLKFKNLSQKDQTEGKTWKERVSFNTVSF